MVTDPAALAVVESARGTFDTLVPDGEFGAIAAVIAGDVGKIKRRDRSAGVGVRGNSHRLFDVRWLRSAKTRFELVGVTFRADRIPVSGGQCGDVRLIYRLAYTTTTSGQQVTSRLPMTVAVLLRGEDKDETGRCRGAAAKWMVPAGAAGAALGKHLVSVGGAMAGLSPDRVDKVLTNLQIVRWPSAVRPDLGGHAEYSLRSFRRTSAGYVEAKLDNTPNVPGLRRDARARARLLAWVRANLNAIDQGTAILPAEFQAKVATSVAPRGLSRRANRLFRQVFKPADLGALDLASYRTIRSSEALLRRLDEQTCVGCHQARTIAGFHLLGEDGQDAVPGNALLVAASPHLLSETKRREGIIARLAAGQPPDYWRPPVERPPQEPGVSGARCGLGDVGFADWTCADGFRCERLDTPTDDSAVGFCLAEGAGLVGEPCEFGALRSNHNPHRDRDPKNVKRPCAAGAVCNTNRVGFPQGMCTGGCDPLPEGGQCGGIALLGPFNMCLARREPFPRCLAEHVAPAGLRACNAANPCREDYICTRTPDGRGACIPPYFLFQLRVDGHAL